MTEPLYIVTSFPLESAGRSCEHSYSPFGRQVRLGILLLLLVGSWGLILDRAAKAQRLTEPLAEPLAQVLDTPPPPPASSVGSAPLPTSGEQYIVFVNGNSPLLLDQIRQVEPEAFLSRHEGRSVIQVGRFNHADNAQTRASELSMLGIEARIATVPAAMTYNTPPAPTISTSSSSGSLPPLPVAATPQNIEFGQSLQGASPAAPVSETTATAPPQVANAPYYVVIPARSQELAELRSQIIQLGTPADQVHARQSPRGPHVAVGPFSDRGLAAEWTDYLRDAGWRSARVHYEP
ncbi:hypothetical protein XM38_034870 [Halomicronema hongdechloris C2206]|uniref:SPOR domain-containing protein n=1 Tax=Halomicronema hongdechloris C2206 TaxID=1641165 RepID=A0A1Z3HQD5_9CYAN|nr:hypothetical protein [Halomicronema hongdechloris]ASC72529.1 hypothetical protein XM38_034870 [Halomicronema hongdechloris C2206]